MLPDFTRPEEFNRLLIHLADADGELSRLALAEIMSLSVFYGLLPNHESTIDAALFGGFTTQRENRISITQLGRRFLALNSELRYELAPGQARFLYVNLIHREPFLTVSRTLFSMFQTKGMAQVQTLDLDLVEISSEQIKVLSLLRHLGVILISKNVATISKEYVQYASAARARRIITVDELEQMLEEQKARGDAAEQVVLAAERERLWAAGHLIESAAVKLVSNSDVAAGYDIESYEGESTSLAPDRFIEVKSTTHEDGVFFWSANERATAEELGDQYWICHLRGFSTEDLSRHSRTWIRNPADKVNTGDLSLSCSQFRVKFDVDIRS